MNFRKTNEFPSWQIFVDVNQPMTFLPCSYNSKVDTWQDVPRYTLDYAPPESLIDPQCTTYSKSYDIWCLGATLYAMYMGHPPFRRSQNEQIHERVVRQRIIEGEMQTKSPRWKNAKPALRQLIVDFCLQRESVKRASIEGLLGHQFLFAKFDKLQKVLCRLNRKRSEEENSDDGDDEEVVPTERDENVALAEMTEECVVVTKEDELIGDIISMDGTNANFVYEYMESVSAERNEVVEPEETAGKIEEQQPAVLETGELDNYKEWQQQQVQQQAGSSQESDTQSTHNRIESEGDATSGLGCSKSSDHTLIERQTLSVNSLNGLEAIGESIECGELIELECVTSEKTVSADELNDSMLEDEVEVNGFAGFDEDEIIERKVNYIDILLAQIEQNKTVTVDIDENQIENVAAPRKTEPVVENTNENISAIKKNAGGKAKKAFSELKSIDMVNETNKTNIKMAKPLKENVQSQDLRTNNIKQRNVKQLRSNKQLAAKKTKTGARRKDTVDTVAQESELMPNTDVNEEKKRIEKDSSSIKLELSLPAESKTIQSRCIRRSMRIPTCDDENNWLGVSSQMRAKYAQRFKARYRLFTLLLFSTQNALRYFKIERRYYEYQTPQASETQEKDNEITNNTHTNGAERENNEGEQSDRRANNSDDSKEILQKQQSSEIITPISIAAFKAITNSGRQTRHKLSQSRNQNAKHESNIKDVVPSTAVRLVPVGTLRTLRQRHVYK